MNQVKIVLALLCLLCLVEMPYSFYEFFRVVALASFVFLAFKEKNKGIWTLFWIISALLVQPFYKFYITRPIWTIIDIIWAIALLYPIFSSYKKT